MTTHRQFHRSACLVGETTLALLAATRVILFGVGGVGSWCAEALIRAGLGHLTLVDPDLVCITNLNRQLQATRETIGQPKVAALRARLLTINPDAAIVAIQAPYAPATRDRFDLASFDYVIDAIDSLANKVDLIAAAQQARTPIFAAMGAARKLDATAIRAASIWNTDSCPLARLVRKALRRRGLTGDFTCVYSAEVRPVCANDPPRGSEDCPCPPPGNANDAPLAAAASRRGTALVNGSSVHVTGAFGFALAGLVLQDVHARAGIVTRPQ